MSENIGKNISKNVSDKNSQKLLNHAKQSATDALKTTSKRVIGNKTADRITKISKTFPQNSLEIGRKLLMI